MSLRAAAGRTEPGSVILSSSDVARVIDRMSHQIIENLEKTGSTGLGNAVLMGIPSRGVPLARRLSGRIEAFSGARVPVGSLDITLHRDDLRRRGIRPLGMTVEPPGGIDGRTVVLVDDVLFSGRSTRAALDALSELGRPDVVQLAVMVDRGHRQLPIRADYVGKNVPTARAESVQVNLAETDGEDGVVIVDGSPQ